MYDFTHKTIQKSDEEIFAILQKEEGRQRQGLELIASENNVSPAVMATMATAFAHKYSEGLPGKRYYGGNQYIDEVENLAIQRAKTLFKAEHVNVQPHSGNPANMAAYHALLDHGDKILALSLDHGGHLSHGLKINFSGKWYEVIAYHTDHQTGLIDMDEVRSLAHEHKPKLIVAGFSAYSRSLNWRLFKEIADEVGAFTMADISHIAGLIAGHQLENPVPFFDVVTTTTHKTLRGPRGAIIMAKKEFGEKIDRAIFPGLQGGPHEHIIAAKAVAFREASTPSFETYAKQIIQNAQALSKALIDHGLSIVTGGTDNHLMLVDMRPLKITGVIAEKALESVDISVNKNMIPFDPEKPMVTSGIRLGTPVLTTRGMKENDMKTIAEFIGAALKNVNNNQRLVDLKKDVHDFTKDFPLFATR